MPATTSSTTLADTVPPVATIASPAAGAVLSAQTDVVGTATDANLVGWVLEIAVAGTESWTTIGSGTTPVTDGVLGTIDVGLLANDGYRLRLRAFDAVQTTATERPFSIATAAKPGAFTLSYRDVRVPAPGFPIDVRRIYDTKRPAPGDFGPGWTLGFTAVDLQTDANHNAYVTLPDGRRTAFAFSPYKPSPFFPTYVNRYLPAAGVYDTIENTDCPSLVLTGGQWFCFPGPLYNPQNFVLKTKLGFTYTISKAGGISKIEDRNGNALTITPTGISSTAGRSLTVVRDASGRVTAITDPAGRSLQYAYDALGRLAAVTDRDGNVTAYDYDGSSHLLVDIDAPGGCRPLRHEYDEDGRLVAREDAAGERTTYAYDAVARTETVTNALGDAATYAYDARGNLLSVEDPFGSLTTYTYSASNDVLSVTNPSGTSIERTYDARGNVLTETRHPAAGQNLVTTYTYSSLDQLASVVRPLGDKTVYGYDAKGNLTSRERRSAANVLLARETFTYDARGNRTTHTDANGGTTTYDYDDFGDLVRIQDQAGRERSFEYDATGNPVAQIDAFGNRTEFTYDALNLLTGLEHDGTTLFTRTYSDLGELRTHTDALGNTMTYDHDCQGSLVGVVDAASGVTTYGRDPLAHLTGVQNARGEATAFTYDAMGRQTRRSGPDGAPWDFGYTGDGFLGSRTTPDGATRTTTYDGARRLVQEATPERTVDYVFDGNDRLASLTDSGAVPPGTTTFAYDALGRVQSVTDAAGRTLAYQRDTRGLPTRRTTPDGVNTLYTYDASGRLTQVAVDGATVHVVYDDAGRRTRTEYSNGASTDYAYDALNRLTAVVIRDGDGAVIASFAYSLDPNGLRSAVTLADGSAAYAYDALHRLVREEVASTSLGTWARDFAYDATGNRLDPGATYGPDDRLLADAANTYAYDANGNLVERVGHESFAYDSQNRLVGWTLGAASAAYGYDAFGRRVRREANGEVREYVWDGADLAVEYRNGALAARYTFGPGLDEPLMVRQAGATWFYHTDGLGSVVAITDAAGHVVQRYGYDAWGELRLATGSFAFHGAGLVNALTFTGREWDDESGLYHLRARAYAPQLGRFLQKDPWQGTLRLPLTQNPYVYALDDPVNVTDPSGRTALIQYAWLVSGPSVVELAAALAGFIHGFGAPNLVFIGEYLSMVDQGLELEALWDEAYRRTAERVQEIERLLGIAGDVEDCVGGFLEGATGIPGAFKSGVGFSVSVSASITLPILSGDVESLASCLGISNPQASVEASAEVQVSGGFEGGAAIALARLRGMRPQ